MVAYALLPYTPTEKGVRLLSGFSKLVVHRLDFC